MSTTTIAILCISALVVSIVVGSVKKVNIGILSLIFAFTLAINTRRKTNDFGQEV